MGVGGRTASSSVPEEAIPRLRASGGKARPGTKLKEVAEEPAPKRRPKKKAEAVDQAPDGDGKVPGPSAIETPTTDGSTPSGTAPVAPAVAEQAEVAAGGAK